MKTGTGNDFWFVPQKVNMLSLCRVLYLLKGKSHGSYYYLWGSDGDVDIFNDVFELSGSETS